MKCVSKFSFPHIATYGNEICKYLRCIFTDRIDI